MTEESTTIVDPQGGKLFLTKEESAPQVLPQLASRSVELPLDWMEEFDFVDGGPIESSYLQHFVAIKDNTFHSACKWTLPICGRDLLEIIQLSRKHREREGCGK